MRQLKRGLVVGKFAPLHLGHEALIEFALQHCEQVLVLSYTSQNFLSCTPAQRRAWFAARYGTEVRIRSCVLDASELSSWPDFPLDLPDDGAPAEVQREFCWQVLRRLGFMPDGVFSSEDYGAGFAAYLSHAAAQPVVHCPFDLERQQHSVSATQIRRGLLPAAVWLSPAVAASYQVLGKIALLGAESTGKTTLSRILAEHLGMPCVAEYGRQRWEERQGQLAFSDLLQIARTQIAHEEAALAQAREGIICDTTPLTTLFYSQALFGHADPALSALAERPYQHLFLLSPDFPLVQDGTRQDEAFRQAQHRWYLAELAQRQLSYQLISGPLEQRIQTILQAVGISPESIK
ncbi:AAA family ATPase [Chitinibacter fontanus]|uniref:AAA family ATPase n=1 Tax=Chitinibacter fontanus TaxID=1737446 RepID=A0A7D5ZA74_9NEIS|nr:AAA family ATPase [Chitinibacter fontanus]QLI82742.1 AAA family ATPase [Chitinibacter fontanus]